MEPTSNELRALSFIDELSGTRNRRGFFLLAERRLEAARSDPGVQVTIVLAVVDGLQEANAWQGRAAGTELIRDAARTLTAAFGPDDVIARLGGGEFAVLCQGGPEDVRERIAKAVADRNEIVAERPYPLALGIGVASRGAAEDVSVDDLIAAADRDLHERNGQSPAGPPPVRTAKSKAGRGSSDRAARRRSAAA